MEEKKCKGLDSYQIEAWIMGLGSFPTRRLKHGQGHEDYSIDKAHLLELENGRYALVTESGCSCYSSSDAVIDLFPTKRDANNSFKTWLRGRDSRKEFEA